MGEERSLARLHQADRTARGQSQQSQPDLYGHNLFSTEAATDEFGPQAHSVVRQADGIGDRAVVFYHLGAGADVENFVLIDPGQGCLRLEEGLLLVLRGKSIFHDEISFSEAFFDVSLADLIIGYDVVVTEDDWCPGCERIEGIVDALAIFIVDFDERKRLFGDAYAFCRHQCDRLTAEAHSIFGQNRLLGVFGHAAGLARHVGHYALAGR